MQRRDTSLEAGCCDRSTDTGTLDWTLGTDSTISPVSWPDQSLLGNDELLEYVALTAAQCESWPRPAVTSRGLLSRVTWPSA